MRLFRRSPPPPFTLAITGDRLVRAGDRARVVVKVATMGEGAETPARVSVYLRMLGWDNKRAYRWPLGEVPPEPGTHELEVEVPTGLAPACVRYSEYSFCADLKRHEGRGVAAATDVDIVAHPDDLYWPDGPRAAGEGLELDADVVQIGGTVSGQVAIDGLVEVGPTLNMYVAGTREPRFEAAASAQVAAGERFSLDLPEAVPPTLYDGNEVAIVWQARVGEARRTFAVIDPEARAGRRDGRSDALLTFLAKLAGDRLWV